MKKMTGTLISTAPCAEKLQNIQQMIAECASHAAHNVNAPLARIKGLAALYSKEPNEQDKHQLVELISQNAEELSSALAIFNALLDDCLCNEKISEYKSDKH